MMGKTRNRGTLAVALVAVIAGCSDPGAPTALEGEAGNDPDAVVILAKVTQGRVLISIASETARPTALLFTLTWDAKKAMLSGDFSPFAGSETIVAADASTPGRLRIAAVGLSAGGRDGFEQIIGEFQLERQNETSKVEVTIEVEQVLENEVRIAPARVVAAPLSIS